MLMNVIHTTIVLLFWRMIMINLNVAEFSFLIEAIENLIDDYQGKVKFKTPEGSYSKETDFAVELKLKLQETLDRKIYEEKDNG